MSRTQAVLTVVIAGAALMLGAAGAATALNPQPLPPSGMAIYTQQSSSSFGSAVSLNPQPLPPRTWYSLGY
ncbi:hypothetical protein [Hoyosella altamirensis]|uniref:Uncharacterized protein n=1 Tax=Hoyosella altamirensis TaxID=616997 RepID=A0A839RQG9_9ACTN|nr:hypothetical protein [Hoyosella altamirensis]MBB3038468.1 hypothetical protein [Hoyosella altamirensis]